MRRSLLTPACRRLIGQLKRRMLPLQSTGRWNSITKQYWLFRVLRCHFDNVSRVESRCADERRPPTGGAIHFLFFFFPRAVSRCMGAAVFCLRVFFFCVCVLLWLIEFSGVVSSCFKLSRFFFFFYWSITLTIGRLAYTIVQGNCWFNWGHGSGNVNARLYSYRFKPLTHVSPRSDFVPWWQHSLLNARVSSSHAIHTPAVGSCGRRN